MQELVWAKSAPVKSLRAHMIDAGACARAYLRAPSSRAVLDVLAESLGCGREETVACAAYLCAMHDIGKCDGRFQCQSPELLARWIDAGCGKLFRGRPTVGFHHEYRSKAFLEDIWSERGCDWYAARVYGKILALHHQRQEGEPVGSAVDPAWEDMQRELEAEVRARFLAGGALPLPARVDAAGMLLTGLVILCDWVASSAPFAGLPEGEDYPEVAAVVAQRALREDGLISEGGFPAVGTFRELWPWIASPRPLQRACEDADVGAGLTIIEAPMGEGKTEAALYLACRMCAEQGKRGFYMALPTQATSNQMVGRAGELLARLGAGSARLMHGMAWLREAWTEGAQAEDAAEWLRPLRRAMLGRSAVGTVDQSMAAVLRTRFSALRLLGLTNKVLVIDEVHACDAYMGEIIEALLHWCAALRIPVILLSATLQEAQRRNYLACFGARAPEGPRPYPLVTQVGADGELRETVAEAALHSAYRFAPIGLQGDAEAIARRAAERVRDGGCLCVLMNTVRGAQEVYRALRALAPREVELSLFHARFPAARRMELEEECLRSFGRGPDARRPQRAILVCTCVVEQSLDLDFDGMMTELAPIDLLLQRAGRVHRHRERVRPAGMLEPCIEVIVPGADAPREPDARYGASGYVYDPFLLKNTEDFLGEGRTVRVPEDMRAAIAACYESLTQENIRAWLQRSADQAYMRSAARDAVFPVPEPDSFFPLESATRFELADPDDGFEPSRRAATRLGEPGVRLAFLDGALFAAAERGTLSREEAQGILLRSVSLRLPKLPACGPVEADVPALRLERGPLKGCVALRAERACRVGPYRIEVDRELGVIWREDAR